MHILLRGGIAQRLRIATGLILFTFATTHFLNHAVGLVRSGDDARGAGLAPGGDPLLAGHHRAGAGAGDAYRARALQAGAAHHAAASALGAVPDRPRAAHPVPAAAAHRQHAHRARVLRRRGQLPLRAGAPVAGKRHPAEHASAHRVAARLHRHPLLAAALSALPRRPAGAAVHRHRRAARRARRLHGVGAHRRHLDRGCAHVRQGEGADALAERRRWRQPRALPVDRPVRLCRPPGLHRPVHRRAPIPAEHPAQDGHHVHGRPDRAGALRADAARDQPHEQDPARLRLRRARALLDLSRAHRRGRGLAFSARLPGSHHAGQHRRAAERAPGLPGPAGKRDDDHAPAAAGQHRAGRRRAAGAGLGGRGEERWP